MLNAWALESPGTVFLGSWLQKCRLLRCSLQIDLFGEIAGTCFSPDGSRFFCSIADLTYSRWAAMFRKVFLSLHHGVSNSCFRGVLVAAAPMRGWRAPDDMVQLSGILV